MRMVGVGASGYLNCWGDVPVDAYGSRLYFNVASRTVQCQKVPGSREWRSADRATSISDLLKLSVTVLDWGWYAGETGMLVKKSERFRRKIESDGPSGRGTS